MNTYISFILLAFISHPALAQDSHQDLGHDAEGVAFVNDQQCQQCHDKAYKAWEHSDHALAMQVATETTVLADFNDSYFKHKGVNSHFFKKGTDFWVNTQNGTGDYQDYQVLYAFGVRPLQQYLLKFPRGRLQALDIAWDVDKKQWFHLQGQETILPNDPLHWSKRYYTWNSQCAECHSTHLRLNYDLKTDSYNTQWSEINVGCQACHGAGQKHIEWSKQAKTATDKNQGLSVNFDGIKGQALVERCARCHARRFPIQDDLSQTDLFSDDFRPMLLQEGFYHADGQALNEVYVYGSFSQTKMHQQGVDCLDCHQAHSGQLKRKGNATCTFCHQSQPPLNDFPSLKSKNYEDKKHHFHQTGSDGAQCVNCHMPAKYDMQIDSRRDHRFSIPRPDLSAQYNTPNACENCHKAKTATWAAEAIMQQTGKTPIPNYSDVFAANIGDKDSQLALLDLFKQREQPAIIRASVLEKLQQNGENHQPLFLQALKDDQALVRNTAARLLQSPLTSLQQQDLVPLLNRHEPNFRQEIARVLNLQSDFTAPDTAKFKQLIKQYKQQLILQTDQAEGYFNLGNYLMQTADTTNAIQAYKDAIARGAYFFPAYHNLANIYYQQKQIEKAEAIYQLALKKDPQQGQIHYSLGLLFAGKKQMQKAAEHIGTAAKLLPNDTHIQYNYSLVLQKQGKFNLAEKVLLKIYQQQTDNTKILQGLSIFYLSAKQWQKALPYVRMLKLKHPQAKEPDAWLKLITKNSRNR